MDEGKHDCIKNLLRNQLSPDATVGIYQCAVCKRLFKITVLKVENIILFDDELRRAEAMEKGEDR